MLPRKEARVSAVSRLLLLLGSSFRAEAHMPTDLRLDRMVTERFSHATEKVDKYTRASRPEMSLSHVKYSSRTFSSSLYPVTR